EIVRFDQTPAQLTIVFSRPTRATVARLSNVPDSLNPAALTKRNAPTAATATSATIALADEPDAAEYSLVVFAGTQWFELVRQSPGWLRRKYGFNKADGYTMLGRRSIGVAGAPVTSFPPLMFKGLPTLPLRISPTSPYPEVNRAIALLRYLW